MALRNILKVVSVVVATLLTFLFINSMGFITAVSYSPLVYTTYNFFGLTFSLPIAIPSLTDVGILLVLGLIWGVLLVFVVVVDEEKKWAAKWENFKKTGILLVMVPVIFIIFGILANAIIALLPLQITGVISVCFIVAYYSYKVFMQK